jgi:alkylation response protein AidB-like acyl-CoA dehydrogenase
VRGQAPHTDERQAVVQQAATEVSTLAHLLPGNDVRTAWQRLLALDTVADIVGAPFRAGRGSGAIVHAVAVLEGLGRGGLAPGLCYALASQLFGIQWPLALLGDALTEDQQHSIVAGTTMLCHALTEETGGSDPLSMTTEAVSDLDSPTGYCLSGRKAFVTAAPVAGLALTFARTAPGRSPFALTGFLVPTDLAGITRGTPLPKLALSDIPMGNLDFDQVRLPARAAVTPEGGGMALLMDTTTWERALLFSYAVGIAQRKLDQLCAWLGERHQFGRPLGASPLVAARVAELAILVHRMRTLVNDIAADIDSGRPLRVLASRAAMVKVSCAQDLAAFESGAGVLSGVRAVIADSGSTADMPSALAASIYAGTNDLLRIGIARDLGMPVEN